MDVTLIQKALWLCRGYFGKHLHKHPLLKGDEGKGDSGLCPLTHVEQINKTLPFLLSLRASPTLSHFIGKNYIHCLRMG